jgi:hypothetical protein
MTKGLTTGIIYIPLDVRWPRTKKVRALIVRHGLDGLAAWALYLAMACYCRENLSDGFVPADEIGALAYPLPPDQADGLLKLLLDHRLVADSPGHSQGHTQGHTQGHSQGHSQGDSTGHSTGHDGGYVVRGYVKRNGTRADAAERADRLAAAGRAGALTRWSDADDSQGHSTGHSTPLWPRDAQTESETESETPPPRTSAPAHAPAHEAAETVVVDSDDFHHQIVALLANSGHAVTYAEAVVIAESLLIGKKPRDPRAWLIARIRNDPAAAVRVLAARKPTGTRQPPPLNQRCRRCSATDHATQDCPDLGGASAAAGDAAHGAELARKQMAERDRPEAEPDLAAAAEEDDRLARQKARARARDPKPADPEPVDGGLPDW